MSKENKPVGKSNNKPSMGPKGIQKSLNKPSMVGGSVNKPSIVKPPDKKK